MSGNKKQKTKICSIDSDVLFPDLSGYEIHNPGELALYCAHMDFFPFKSVIDFNKKAIDSVMEGYRQDVKDNTDDFEKQCRAMTSGTLVTCRVENQIYYSLLLTLVSLLEDSVNTFCKLHKEMRNIQVDIKDTHGNGLERAAKYIKEELNIKGFTTGKWEYITAIRDARNMVVHNGGRVFKEEDFKKFDKFNICYREEDKKLIFTYEDIYKFYEAILEFMDASFRLEPENSN